MKKLYLLLASLFIFLTVFSQKKKTEDISFYVFDASWKSCKTEDAVYFASLEKISDTAWQWKNYHFSGPLISVETYKDENTTIPNGYFAWFDARGRIDSCGYTRLGKKHDSWLFFTDSLTIWQSDKYDNGVLIERKDSITLLLEREKNDSIKEFPDEKEATFKGGDKGWIKYLQSNIKYPERAEKMGKTGTVKIFFMVDTDGTLKNIRLYQSVEYSLDEEGIRLLRKSPKWEPAFQNGKNVKAYRIQPVTFAN
jgi:protein TonB